MIVELWVLSDDLRKHLVYETPICQNNPWVMERPGQCYISWKPQEPLCVQLAFQIHKRNAKPHQKANHPKWHVDHTSNIFKHLQTSSIQTFETSSDLSLFRHWRFLLRLTSGKLGSLRSKTSLRPKSAALEPTMRDTMRHLQHLKDSPAGSLLRHMPVHNPWPVINQKNATNALQKLGQAILTHLERLTISYDNVSDKRQMTPQSYAHASSSWMQILPGRPSNCPEKTTMPVSSRAEQTELWDMGPGNGSIQSWNILELLWNCCRLQYL